MKLTPELEKIAILATIKLKEYSAQKLSDRKPATQSEMMKAVFVPALSQAAELLVRDCAEIAKAHYDTNKEFAALFDKNDQRRMVDRALADAAEASRIREAILRKYGLE